MSGQKDQIALKHLVVMPKAIHHLKCPKPASSSAAYPFSINLCPICDNTCIPRTVITLLRKLEKIWNKWRYMGNPKQQDLDQHSSMMKQQCSSLQCCVHLCCMGSVTVWWIWHSSVDTILFPDAAAHFNGSASITVKEFWSSSDQCVLLSLFHYETPEHSNELLGSIQGSSFLDQLRNCHQIWYGMSNDMEKDSHGPPQGITQTSPGQGHPKHLGW